MHKSIVLSFFQRACIAHTVAILLHGYWAIYDPPSTSLWYAIHHTILVITISCKGQGGRLSGERETRREGREGKEERTERGEGRYERGREATDVYKE